MAVVRRVRRLVNPRRSTSSVRRRRKGRNPRSRHRRRLTPAQIKAGFGGKRAQSAFRKRRRVKSNPKRVRRHKRRSNPAAVKTRVVYRTKTKVKYRTRIKRVRAKAKHRRRRSNPGLLVTMGPALAGNPRKRRHSSVARRRKRRASNPRRRHHRRRANPAKIVYRYRGRKRNAGRHRRKRNPTGFGGGMGFASGGKAIIFGLAGVTVTKTAASFLPASVVSSPLMRVVASAAIAWGGGALVSKWDRNAGNAFMFGGFMQAGSVALNAFLPSLGSIIGLQGLRGLVSTNDILLPYNPMLGRGAMVAAGSPGSAAVAGARGFAPAFA